MGGTNENGQFYRVIRLAGIELPEGQISHVLRHSFASHLIMAGGKMIVPQCILRHSNIRVTMRYAHFAPDYPEDAIRFNSLAFITKKNGGKEFRRGEQKVTEWEITH
nr:tyrosine-type recombinase/integrase [Pantoea deleyi]